MKKIISVMLSVILILSTAAVVLVAAAVESKGKITLTETEGKTGEEVSVDVVLSENPGFTSIRIQIDFDNTKLHLKDVKDAGLMPVPMTDIGEKSFETGSIVVMFKDSKAKELFTGTGKLCTLVFDIITKDDCKADVTAEVLKAYTVELDDVAFDADKGVVTVKGADVDVPPVTQPPIDEPPVTNPPVIPGKGKITLTDANGKSGEDVSVDLVLSDNPGFTSIRIQIDFDNTKLKLKDVKDAGLMPVPMTDIGENSFDTGSIVVMFKDSKAKELFTGTGKLCTLIFEILSQESGSLDVTAEVLEAYNVELDDVEFEEKNGVVGVEAVALTSHDKLLAAFRADKLPLAASPVSEVMFRDLSLVYPENFANKKGIDDAAYTLRFADTDDDGTDELIVFAMVRDTERNEGLTVEAGANQTIYQLRVTGYDIAEDGSVRSDSFEPAGFDTAWFYEDDGFNNLYAAVYDGKVNLLNRWTYEEVNDDFQIYSFVDGKFAEDRHEKIVIDLMNEDPATRSYIHKLFDGDREYSSSNGIVGDDAIVQWIGKSFTEITDPGVATALYPMNRSGMPVESSALVGQYDFEFSVIYDAEKNEKSLYFNDRTGSYETYGAENSGIVRGDFDNDGDVDIDDAFYIIYYKMWGEEDYPLNQSADFDKDGDTDIDDAFYLIYYKMWGAEEYPLD